MASSGGIAAAAVTMRSARTYLRGDGTDEGAALAAAIADVQARGEGLTFPAGFLVTSSTTTVVPAGVPVHMDNEAALIYTGSGIGLDINGWSYAAPNRLMGAASVRVRHPGATWDTGADTTSVGVRLRNAQFCVVDIAEVTGFETGVLMHGDGDGCCYNTITLGAIVDNKRNLRFDGVNGGWANQNLFLGGACRHNSGWSSYAGTVLVDLSATGNNNVFVAISLEGAYSETTVAVAVTSNQFLACRYEANGPGTFKLLAGSDGNQVIGGSGNGGPLSKMFADASGGRNHILGARGMSMGSDSSAGAGQSNGGAAYESQATYSGNDVLFRGRNTDGSVRYEVTAVGAAKYYGAGNPAYPNVIIDPSTAGGTSYGGLEWGRGNAAPDTRFSRGANGIPCWISNAPWLKSIVTQTLAAAGPVTITAKSGDVQQVTLQANATAVTLASPVLETGYAQQIELSVIQDGTGGRTWVAPANVAWSGGAAPALTTTANARDIFTLRYDTVTSKWVEVSRSLGVR